MWFHVSPPTASLPPLPAERPLCTCGVHTAWSRSRIAMLNDTARSHLYLCAFTQVHIMCTAFNSCLPILLTGGARHTVRVKNKVILLSCNWHTTKIPIQLSRSGKQMLSSVLQVTQTCSWHNGQQLYRYVLVLCTALTPCANMYKCTSIHVYYHNYCKRRVACDIWYFVWCVHYIRTYMCTLRM